MMKRTLISAAAIVMMTAAAPAVAFDSVAAPDAPNAPKHWPCAPPAYEPTTDRVVQLSVEGVPVNVLVPEGYAGPDERLGVLYVPHGGGMNRNEWFAYTDIVEFSGDDPVVVVTWDTTPGSFHANWPPPRPRWESFLLDTLIPAVETRFLGRVVDRSRRAIAGLSMGGFGAMHYAARHPERFVAAGSFSGAVDIMSPTFRVPAFAALAADGTTTCDAAIKGTPSTPWGDPVTNEVQWRNHNPTDLAANLGGIAVFVGSGNGVPCQAEELAGAVDGYPLLEPEAKQQSETFVAALRAADVEHTGFFPSCGLHDFAMFERQLHEFWPQMLAAFGTPAPASFDHRSTDASLSAWGWRFSTHPDRAPEFLDVIDASANGVTLRGSGPVEVTTAPLFSAGERVALSDDRIVSSDNAGRLRFVVDLGPPHTAQQYTAEQRAAEAIGGRNYWVTRTITFGTGGNR